MSTSISHDISPAHRRFIRLETAIGAVMSGAVPALLIWLLSAPGAVPLTGPDSLASSLIPGTLLPAFGMPVILSLVIRFRVRSGGAPALAWPVADAPLANRMPRLLVLRGLIGALAAMLVLPGPGLALLALCGVGTLSRLEFVAYNFVHGVGIGLLLLPTIVTAAMADGDRLGRIGQAA